MSQQDMQNMQSIARLKNLNVVGGRRRVAPTIPPYMEEEEFPDVSGTAYTSQALPPPPEGQEIPQSKSYDVRSNQIIPTQYMGDVSGDEEIPQKEEQGIWGKLGSLLKYSPYYNMPAHTAKKEAFQQIEQEPTSLPQASPQVQEAAPFENPEISGKTILDASIWDRLGTALKDRLKEGQYFPEEAAIPQEQQAVESEQPQIQPQQGVEAPLSQQEAAPNQEALEKKEPLTYAEPGSVEQLYSNPSLSQAVDKMFGIKMTPELIQEISDMEMAIKGYTDALNGHQTRLTEHQEELRNQIANKDMNGTDKMLMAIALLAPAIIGGVIGGPEAFLGGIAGGAQSLSGVLKGQEKEKLGMQDRLSELSLESAKAEKEKFGAQKEQYEMAQKIRESVPNYKLHKMFMEKGEILPNGQLALKTGNDLLPLRADAVQSEEDVKSFKKVTMPKLATELAATKEAIRVIDELKKIVDYGKEAEKSQSFLGGLAKGTPLETLGKGLKANIPYLRNTYTDPKTGQELDLHAKYDTLLRQWAAMYARTELGKGQFTGTSEEHALTLLPNPFSKQAFKEGKSDLNSNTEALYDVYKKLAGNIMGKAEMAGVDVTPMQELFQSSQINQYMSTQQRQKNRAEMAAKQVIEGK